MFEPMATAKVRRNYRYRTWHLKNQQTKGYGFLALGTPGTPAPRTTSNVKYSKLRDRFLPALTGSDRIGLTSQLQSPRKQPDATTCNGQCRVGEQTGQGSLHIPLTKSCKVRPGLMTAASVIPLGSSPRSCPPSRVRKAHTGHAASPAVDFC